MDRKCYGKLESYMQRCMQDSAHDQEHVYRVLYQALDIAGFEKDADLEVLVAACLLHDIGRKEQFDPPGLCHARVGSQKAYAFLVAQGWTEARAAHVRDCIGTHRFRADRPPQTLEAKILFDADKIDVTGTLGIARTLLYKAEVGEPLYSVLADGTVADGSGKEETPSFFQEYHYKLKKLYDGFYTARGREIALSRRQSAADFYAHMLAEVRGSYSGRDMLRRLLGNAD